MRYRGMSRRWQVRRINAFWRSWLLGFVLALHVVPAGGAGGEHRVASGTVAFTPTAEEREIPARFRMASNHFGWQAKRMETVTETLEVWDVTFPSPVETPVEVNNTVHCEYYRSRQAGRRPAVIVLHILGGDFPLARLFSNVLAQHGVHALFLKMPYYGPRRDAHSPARMVSPDPHDTVAGMTQAVLDIRRATVWLGSRDEVDAQQIGVFGISLGGITAALAVSNEPRLKNACLLLAGGGIAAAGWDAPQAGPVRERWLAQGKTREEFVEQLRAVDPVPYAQAARGKRILMLNATDDEVIPRACTVDLWESLGKPEIRWLSGGHFSVARHLANALLIVAHFFADDS